MAGQKALGGCDKVCRMQITNDATYLTYPHLSWIGFISLDLEDHHSTRCRSGRTADQCARHCWVNSAGGPGSRAVHTGWGHKRLMHTWMLGLPIHGAPPPVCHTQYTRVHTCPCAMHAPRVFANMTTSSPDDHPFPGDRLSH